MVEFVVLVVLIATAAHAGPLCGCLWACHFMYRETCRMGRAQWAAMGRAEMRVHAAHRGPFSWISRYAGARVRADAHFRAAWAAMGRARRRPA